MAARTCCALDPHSISFGRMPRVPKAGRRSFIYSDQQFLYQYNLVVHQSALPDRQARSPIAWQILLRQQITFQDNELEEEWRDL